jgi:hypothetical protein
VSSGFGQKKAVTTPTRNLPTDLEPPKTTPPALHPVLDEDLAVLRDHIPEDTRDHEADMMAFWRELPRLLEEGGQGRCALVHGGRIVSLWDTHSDAVQAGYDKFGLEGRFLVQDISHKQLDRIREFVTQHRAK